MTRNALIVVMCGVLAALYGCAGEARWVATPVPESGAFGELALEGLESRVAIATYNLANLDTPGFKPMVVLGPGENGLPVTENSVERGSPVFSNRVLDMFINGNGFFRVVGEFGYFYTRCGRFTLNGEGEIVMAALPHLRLEPSIAIPIEATGLTIDAKGIVTVTLPGCADPVEVGQVQLNTFPSPTSLHRTSVYLFEETAGSGSPIDFVPGEGVNLLQNYYESSAVDPAREQMAIERAHRQMPLWSKVAAK